jgi:hypothetical protein
VHQLENPPIYGIPFSMDHTSEGKPLEQVSTIKTLLQSYDKLLKDSSSINILQNMIEGCNAEVEGKSE